MDSFGGRRLAERLSAYFPSSLHATLVAWRWRFQQDCLTRPVASVLSMSTAQLREVLAGLEEVVRSAGLQSLIEVAAEEADSLHAGEKPTPAEAIDVLTRTILTTVIAHQGIEENVRSGLHRLVAIGVMADPRIVFSAAGEGAPERMPFEDGRLVSGPSDEVIIDARSASRWTDAAVSELIAALSVVREEAGLEAPPRFVPANQELLISWLERARP